MTGLMMLKWDHEKDGIEVDLPERIIWRPPDDIVMEITELRKIVIQWSLTLMRENMATSAKAGVPRGEMVVKGVEKGAVMKTVAGIGGLVLHAHVMTKIATAIGTATEEVTEDREVMSDDADATYFSPQGSINGKHMDVQENTFIEHVTVSSRFKPLFNTIPFHLC